MINHLGYAYHFIGVNRSFSELATVRKKKYQLITRSDRGKKYQAEAFVYLIAYECVDISSEMFNGLIVLAPSVIGRAKEMISLNPETEIINCRCDCKRALTRFDSLKSIISWLYKVTAQIGRSLTTSSCVISC